MSRNCKWCDSSEHTQFYCRKKPRKPIATRRPLNRIGKQGKRTAAAVTKWKRTVEASHEGYYFCYICQRPVDYLMAEHVMSKARRKDLRTDPSNFEPVCSEHNRLKGSLNIQDFLEKYPEFKKTAKKDYLKEE